MKVLLTGATGYIGKRLLPVLIEEGHQIVCCVRDKGRFALDQSYGNQVEVIEADFLNPETLKHIPQDIDAAYYLLHSMSGSDDYEKLELDCARNFIASVSSSRIKHVIYLSGIINEDSLSRHLASRKAVEYELDKGVYNFTTLRAGIIIGSGSASFEIIRDLVEKLPVMIAPKWLNTKCQPIGVADVIQFLRRALLNEHVYNQSFDIGGPDVLSYKEMLLGFAKVRGLRRMIITVPVMTPKLSSYWLYFVTSTSYKLASALVSSMKIEVVCKASNINQTLGVTPLDYTTALRKTLYKIESDDIISSWKDAWISSRNDKKIELFLEVPEYGSFKDKRQIPITDRAHTLNKIWAIGGKTGWYYGNWLWKIRGFLDKLFGGVGLRRGRTHQSKLTPGDAIDFWRVLYADKKEGRLLLFAEMKLPGEAWLEFKIVDDRLIQIATFRPRGLMGRLYWYAVLPFHGLIFNGMMQALASSEAK